METLIQVCCVVISIQPSATPTCSDYSSEQTAPAADSLAPGWQCRKEYAHLQVKEFKEHMVCQLFPETPRTKLHFEQPIVFVSRPTCGTWNLIWAPTDSTETCFCTKRSPEFTVTQSHSLSADIETSQAAQHLMAAELKSSLKPEWLIFVCRFVFLCLIKDND